jgi:hypothetical protein
VDVYLLHTVDDGWQNLNTTAAIADDGNSLAVDVFVGIFGPVGGVQTSAFECLTSGYLWPFPVIEKASRVDEDITFFDKCLCLAFRYSGTRYNQISAISLRNLNLPNLSLVYPFCADYFMRGLNVRP